MVTLEPLAVFGPQDGAGIVTRVGYYAAGNAATKTELFTVPNASFQALQPVTTGTLTFDPGNTAFGVYSIWPAFWNRAVFSEDALNTFAGAIPHHVRVYPYREADGTPVANAYVVATEETTSGFDYQDVVYVIRNVAPACVTAAECTGSLPACGVFACNAGVCNIVPGNTGSVCRGSAGECDPQETCSGASTTCPGDTKAPSGTGCTDDGNQCTNDQCDGANVLCQHPDKGAGTACGSGADTDCDNPDTCNGAGACQANNEVNGTACTTDGNPCTLDQCSAGVCAHPAGNAGAVCRASAGECDPQETCSGASATCPADALAGAGTPCTSDGNPCTDDQCSAAGACLHTPNAAPCSDGDACTTPDACAAGACAGGPALGGQSCATGLLGACGAGTTACTTGSVTCVPDATPQPEVCGNSVDEDCDGELDDADTCSLFCAPENTVTAGAQTKRTIVRVSDQLDRDKVITKGTFVLPSSGLGLSATTPVTLGLSDGGGNVLHRYRAGRQVHVERQRQLAEVQGQVQAVRVRRLAGGAAQGRQGRGDGEVQVQGTGPQPAGPAGRHRHGHRQGR